MKVLIRTFRTIQTFVVLLVCVALVAVTSEMAMAQAVRVNGYYRKDGTYVRPHYRSRPDGNFWNNWSTYGNINPYTGKRGTRRTPPRQSRNNSSSVHDVILPASRSGSTSLSLAPSADNPSTHRESPSDDTTVSLHRRIDNLEGRIETLKSVIADKDAEVRDLQAKLQAERRTIRFNDAFRIWTSSNGSHNVIARLTEYRENDYVILERLDSRAVRRVRIDALSAVDRVYLSTPDQYRRPTTFAVEVRRVEDGDTLLVEEVETKNQFVIAIVSIDAPGLDEAWNQEAKNALQALVDGKHLDILLTEARRRDGVPIVKIVCNGIDVSTEMLRMGLARYVDNSSDPDTSNDRWVESNARNSGVGFWRDDPVYGWGAR